MSLFVAALAFPDPELLAMAKIGVLGGSMLAALIGTLILLRRTGPSAPAA
jgi:NhaA family Na+:H+ antiporter